MLSLSIMLKTLPNHLKTDIKRHYNYKKKYFIKKWKQLHVLSEKRKNQLQNYIPPKTEDQFRE